MPDGEAYDGRFNLEGDREMAEGEGFDPDDPTEMAAFYGLTLEEYVAVQEWAREKLPKLQEEREKWNYQLYGDDN